MLFLTFRSAAKGVRESAKYIIKQIKRAEFDFTNQKRVFKRCCDFCSIQAFCGRRNNTAGYWCQCAASEKITPHFPVHLVAGFIVGISYRAKLVSVPLYISYLYRVCVCSAGFGFSSNTDWSLYIFYTPPFLFSFKIWSAFYVSEGLAWNVMFILLKSLVCT